MLSSKGEEEESAIFHLGEYDVIKIVFTIIQCVRGIYLQQPEGAAGTGLSICRQYLIQGFIPEINNTTTPTLYADLSRNFRSRGR